MIDAVGGELDLRMLVARGQVVELDAHLVAGEHGRDRVLRVGRAEERRLAAGGVALVEEDHADGARLQRELRLRREGAGAALDQRDVALHRRRVVRRDAAAGAAAVGGHLGVADGDDLGGHGLVRRVLHGDEVDGRVPVVLGVAGHVGLAAGRRELHRRIGELLPIRHVEHRVADVVGARLLERRLHVGGRGGEARRARVARAAVEVGDVLQRLLVRVDPLGRDRALQARRVHVLGLGHGGRGRDDHGETGGAGRQMRMTHQVPSLTSDRAILPRPPSLQATLTRNKRLSSHSQCDLS